MILPQNERVSHFFGRMRLFDQDSQLVCGMELDQAAGRWLFVQHLGPAIVGPSASSG